MTEGSRPGIEVARSLGDLSHTLYTPAENTAVLSDAKTGELLFVDYWVEPSGMETFFSNPFAAGGGPLVSSREESEWMPAPAAFTFQVPAPAGTPARFLRLLRAPVRSAEGATVVLGSSSGPTSPRRVGADSSPTASSYGPLASSWPGQLPTPAVA